MPMTKDSQVLTAPGTRSGYNEHHNMRYEGSSSDLQSVMPLTATKGPNTNDYFTEGMTRGELLSQS